MNLFARHQRRCLLSLSHHLSFTFFTVKNKNKTLHLILGGGDLFQGQEFSSCILTIKTEFSFYSLLASRRPQVIASGNIVCQNILRNFQMTSAAPGSVLSRVMVLCIKAINKIIGLDLLLQTSGQLAHCAYVKDNCVAVTGVTRVQCAPQHYTKCSVDPDQQPAVTEMVAADLTPRFIYLSSVCCTNIQ